jgi:hypothetical protein
MTRRGDLAIPSGSKAEASAPHVQGTGELPSLGLQKWIREPSVSSQDIGIRECHELTLQARCTPSVQQVEKNP